MNTTVFYLCPVCFEASDVELPHHPHRMMLVDPGAEGSDRRKPAVDIRGHLVSRAPRWFLESFRVYYEQSSTASRGATA